MNVYVESNFVLELVFQQEQAESCQELVALGAAHQVELFVPIYSFAEPYEKLRRQSNERKELQERLFRELRQLQRSTPYSERLGQIEGISTLLVQSNEEESKRFSELRLHLVESAKIIPLTEPILKQAISFETEYSLTPTDAIVLSSVFTSLRENPSTENCFLNRDRKGFDNPDIVNRLKPLHCPIIPRFDRGLELVRSRLAQ